MSQGTDRRNDDSRWRYAVDRAVTFLAGRQLGSGEFPTWAASDRAMRERFAFHSSPYVTTYVAHSLRFVSGETAGTMRRAALAFLVCQMEGPGVWRFHASALRDTLLPDLDDTACASALLRSHPRILFGSNLPLFLENRDDRGLFYTWLRADDGPNCVDTAVNANVVFYLGARPETEAACEHLVAAVGDGHERRALFWTFDEVALFYLVSRTLHAGVRQLAAVAPIITEAIRCSGLGDDAHHAALALATLLNVGDDDVSDLNARANFLLETQRSDGSWPCRAAFTGPDCFYGSEELTTGFCIEALARYAGRPRSDGAVRA